MWHSGDPELLTAEWYGCSCMDAFNVVFGLFNVHTCNTQHYVKPNTRCICMDFKIRLVHFLTMTYVLLYIFINTFFISSFLFQLWKCHISQTSVVCTIIRRYLTYIPPIFTIYSKVICNINVINIILLIHQYAYVGTITVSHTHTSLSHSWLIELWPDALWSLLLRKLTRN